MLATAWLLGIANPQSIKRLGHFLTADCKSAGTPNGGKGISGATDTEQQSRTIRLDVSRQEMADIFGIQKFSLLRCLSEFEEKGAIRIEGKTITILNSDEMK